MNAAKTQVCNFRENVDTLIQNPLKAQSRETLLTVVWIRINQVPRNPTQSYVTERQRGLYVHQNPWKNVWLSIASY